jgi:predicted dehydrogenase
MVIMIENPTGIAIIGMGGFAGAHQWAVKELEQQGICKLVCTCTRNIEASRELAGTLELTARGVRVFDSYIDMLDECLGSLDVVCVPSPVPLHAEMHRAGVERGLAVYLEKPPTLDYEEFLGMLEVEGRASKLTNVGFNYIIEDERQGLKRRLLEGEFGPLRRVCFSGLWPRSTAYYGRASWAGRLMLDGRLVLDSCMGNAMAHFVHNCLFWAGPGDLYTWSEVTSVEAELYRAHAIEGSDTIFVKGETRDGIELRLALSHACDGEHRHFESVICDDAVIRYVTGREYRVTKGERATETAELREDHLLAKNISAYCDFVRGEAERPVTRLVDSRPFVVLHGIAYVAAQRVQQIPEQYLAKSPSDDDDGTLVAVRDLDAVVHRFFSDDLFPSQQDVGWGGPSGRAAPADITRLHDVARAML